MDVTRWVPPKPLEVVLGVFGVEACQSLQRLRLEVPAEGGHCNKPLSDQSSEHKQRPLTPPPWTVLAAGLWKEVPTPSKQNSQVQALVKIKWSRGVEESTPENQQ
ncbi:hypothetical protein AOLI_G00113970 [Acnodon oligacanthus]